MVKIRVTFDCGEVHDFDTIDEAESAIEQALDNGTLPLRVCQVWDEDGEETGKEWLPMWTCELEDLEGLDETN